MTRKTHQFLVSVPARAGMPASLAASAVRDALRGHGDFFGSRCRVRVVAASAMGSGWIDVRDRLPTHNYSVLGVVFDGPLVVAGDPDDRLRDVVSYEPTRGWLQFTGAEDGSDAVVTVTHWQDIPALP